MCAQRCAECGVKCPAGAQAQKLTPRRHWRLLSNQDPSPRTTLAQQRVKLRPADSDGTTIGQHRRPARRFDGGHKVAFRCQISFNQGCEIVHDPTSGSGRLDSQRDKEIAGCARFPKSDQLIEVSPAASFRGSTHAGIATVARPFRIAGPSFRPLLLHARFAGSPAATVGRRAGRRGAFARDRQKLSDDVDRMDPPASESRCTS
jgi:hypothetical protein